MNEIFTQEEIIKIEDVLIKNIIATVEKVKTQHESRFEQENALLWIKRATKIIEILNGESDNILNVSANTFT